MASKVSKEILAGFIEEAKGYLPAILKGLKAYQADQTRQESLEEIYRLVHTIKGASGMVGLAGLSHIAYFVEEVLEDIGASKVPMTEETTTLLVKTLGRIGDYLEAAEKGSYPDRPLLSEVAREFRRFRGLPVAEDEQALRELLADLGDEEEPAAPAPPEELSAPVAEDEPVFVPDEELLPELLEAFWQEAEEHIQQVNLLLADLARSGYERETVQEIRRRVHTLKGAAGSVGIKSLAGLSHRMEDLLDDLYEGKRELDPAALELLSTSGDALEDLANETLPPAALNELLARYGQLYGERGRGAATPRSVSAPPRPEVTPPEEEEIPAELLEAFYQEAEEHLRNLGLRLTELAREGFDKGLVQDVRRSVHTLKGAAGSIGMRAVAALAHRMEDLLDQVYEGEMSLSSDLTDLLASSADVLEDLLIDSSKVAPETIEALELRYTGLFGTGAAPAPPVKKVSTLEPLGEEKIFDLTETPYAEAGHEALAPEAAEPVKARQPGEFVRVPLERLDELVRLVSELVITRTTFEQRLGKLASEVNELQASIERLRRISVNLETKYEVTTLGGGSRLTVLGAEADRHDFDTLEFDRYTEFHLLTRELSETSSDIKTVGNDLGTLIGDFDSTLTRQSRLSSELQEKLMRVRMVPLATLATRMHRVARVVARQQNKDVNLILEGERVELDKIVMEQIADPLMHIIRNAVDHGIEPPELRRVLGKPETGAIILQAMHEGNQVVIRVSDDGGGLEPQTLRAKAISGGYVSEADAASLTAEELHALIFIPGFSTAGQISEISGRGVGMDIVRENVHKLKGTITIDSTPGEGTTFTIRLPMTLAVTRALMVRANREVFAIPLGAVTQILRIEDEEVKYVGQKPVIHVSHVTYPVYWLGKVLGLKQPADSASQRLPVLILQAGGKTIALIVDQIIQGREIVIKPLGDHLRYVHGITGATIMGDGSVVLILNPAELVAAPSRAEAAGGGLRPEIIIPAARRPLNVLIVDDSVSVRRVLANLVKNAGWKSILAKDGLEALTRLQEMTEPPDVMLVDIEMPRMDGYELTSTLRGMTAYHELPIIMLTSRGGEKHRQKGFEVGATEYVTKPYQDEMLLGLIRRVTVEKVKNHEVS